MRLAWIETARARTTRVRQRVSKWCRAAAKGCRPPAHNNMQGRRRLWLVDAACRLRQVVALRTCWCAARGKGLCLWAVRRGFGGGKIADPKMYQMLSRSPGMTKRERGGAECILQKWRIISSKIGHVWPVFGGACGLNARPRWGQRTHK